MIAPARARRNGGPIDWPAVHARLARVQAALDGNWAPTAAQAQAVLRERARALAQPLRGTALGTPLEVIEFRLAGESYAIESAWVAEVFPLAGLTRLPGTPPFVLGIVNMRGEIISVIDLGKFFDLPARGLTDLNKVIVLQSREMVFGILADRVEGVCTIDAERLQGALPTLTDRRRDYFRGIADGRLVVLDGAALLADPRMVVNEVVED
jgi:purine-binding chemotaxis protein CheW